MWCTACNSLSGKSQFISVCALPQPPPPQTLPFQTVQIAFRNLTAITHESTAKFFTVISGRDYRNGSEGFFAAQMDGGRLKKSPPVGRTVDIPSLEVVKNFIISFCTAEMLPILFIHTSTFYFSFDYYLEWQM